MKKRIILFFFIFYFLNILPAMQKAAQGMVEEQLTGVPSLVEIITNDIQKAKQGLTVLTELIKNIKTYFKKTTYLNGTSIAITKEGEGGIWFDFGYQMHGDLSKPFAGFKTRLDMNKIPGWLDVAFLNTFAGMGFNSIINISASNEFLIKLFLLFNDVKNKLIFPKEARTEIFFLLYRLALVKDVNSFELFFELENNLIYKVVSSVKVNGKPFSDILDNYWKNFREIVNYDFKIELSNSSSWVPEYLIETNDWAKILKISSAIGLKSAVDYYAARDKFLNTQKGQELNLKIIDAQNKKDKYAAIKEFTKAMPEYQELLNDIQKKTYGFLKRIKGIRTYWNEFVVKIQPTLDPFFKSIGLPFDLVVRDFDDLENIDAIENLYGDSSVLFDPESGSVDFYGVESFDVTDF